MVKTKKLNMGIGKPIRTRTSKAQPYKMALSPYKMAYTRKKYGGHKDDDDLKQALQNVKNKKDPISQDKDLTIIDLFIDTDKNPLILLEIILDNPLPSPIKEPCILLT